MEAVCKFDLTAGSDDELSFRKDDLIMILSTEVDENWWKAERDGREGLVPCNYIETKFNKWFQSGMTRKGSEEFLHDKLLGGFIVRPSESSPDGFSLSVKYAEGQVHHFKILKDDFRKYYIWTPKFDSINALLAHYKSNSLSKTQDVRLMDIFPQYVRAVYDFKTTETDELSFRAGDIILLTDDNDLSWYFGTTGGRTGQFPASYVMPCSDIP